jgi:hypothetical protein
VFLLNRDVKKWNQLLAEALGTFRFKPKIVRGRLRKANINEVK